MTVKAYGAHAGTLPLEPMDITRRAPGAHDVQINIAYCGVCHSDIHQVRAEWAGTLYPCVPGHEIVGRGRWRSRLRFLCRGPGGGRLHCRQLPALQ